MLAVTCGDPPFVKNTLINYDRISFGSKAHYSCVSGNYLLDGPSYLTCDLNGRWIGDGLPKCIGKLKKVNAYDRNRVKRK